MSQRKFEREVDHAYISKNGDLVFLIIKIDGNYVLFRSFHRNDGSYKDTRKWLDNTFRDSVEREVTPAEKGMLDLQAAAEEEQEMVARRKDREKEYLAQVSKSALILEVQRRGLIEDILSVIASEEQFMAAARRRDLELIEKEN